MIARLATACLIALFAPAVVADEVARILYLGLADDPLYDLQPAYTGLSLKDRHRPLAGARVAMRDTRVLARALGITFELEELLLEPGTPAAPVVRAHWDSRTLAVILDLPSEQMWQVVNSEGDSGAPLINVRNRELQWREGHCAPNLLHTIPSDLMLSDALAQFLRTKGWTDVLLLAGTSGPNRELAEAARRSAQKFGLSVVAEREFELGNDPRSRDLNNVALMTGGVQYDVVWLLDSDGEFGRYVPFETYLPRPVVGSEGLIPLAWHWTYERHGAPQLNQRFRRDNNRDMSSEDWAAWAAVRAVVESVSRVGSTDVDEISAYMTSEALSLDLYKGAPGNFRSWNGQLRQPILLATHNAVIGQAPFEAFKHEVNTLDSLGIDGPETKCGAR